MDPVEITAIGAIATGTLGVLSACVGAIRYLWVRDPAAARNGTLDRLTKALDKVAEGQTAQTKAVEEHDDRAAERHSAIIEVAKEQLRATEKLADTIAPRRPVGQ